MVGGPEFEPGASRSRTVVAVSSGRAARGRLSSPRLRLQSATCRYVSVDAARVATRRCYTTWAKSLRPERWAQKAALRSGIELDGVSEPHSLKPRGGIALVDRLRRHRVRVLKTRGLFDSNPIQGSAIGTWNQHTRGHSVHSLPVIASCARRVHLMSRRAREAR